MWRFTDRQRVNEELQHLLKFLLDYFGTKIQTVVIYGSYLRWSFRKDSDVDVAMILSNSTEWQWSSSESFWNKRDNSPRRKDFFRKLEQFLKELHTSHPYDVKVFTTRDLTLLEEFQERVVPARGNLVTSIKNGRVIFQQKETNMAEVKKGHISFMEFLDKELPTLGMTHWYGSTQSDNYGLGPIDYHDIGKVVTEEQRFLFFTWTLKRRITIASITAEPDSPVHKGARNAFRIRVKDREVLPMLQTLAEKFESTNFGLKAELVY